MIGVIARKLFGSSNERRVRGIGFIRTTRGGPGDNRLEVAGIDRGDGVVRADAAATDHGRDVDCRAGVRP